MTTPQPSPPAPDVTPAAGTKIIAAAPPAVPRSRFRRTGRRIGRVAVILAALVAVSAGANAVLTVRDGLARPYGELVTLAGGAVNTATSGTGDETFVIMPGFGAASPVLEFAPLVDDLDDHATVVVVEPFGYGWSDRRTKADRTLENMSNELHQTLTALEVHQPYTLVAHSIGALYALDYVNRFPGEVRAVVTIDGSVPIDAVASEAQQHRLTPALDPQRCHPLGVDGQPRSSGARSAGHLPRSGPQHRCGRWRCATTPPPRWSRRVSESARTSMQRRCSRSPPSSPSWPSSRRTPSTFCPSGTRPISSSSKGWCARSSSWWTTVTTSTSITRPRSPMRSALFLDAPA